MKKKLKATTVQELLDEEWYTGISNREELNALNFDELMKAIGVDDLEYGVAVRISDTWYDKTHQEYVICFALDE